ncbi:MAG: hypothetical protein ACP5QO_11065 [Clostridia bacterium]
MSAAEGRDLLFLFFAYTALFLVMFGFLFRMTGKTKLLRQEIDLLKDEVHLQGSDPFQDAPEHDHLDA